ncbi:HSP90 family protein [Luteolibacter sp. LG18]|uniref:HSP90 family protein n=1 Tax=Luteolibacter sp. LG18 TaxID=2819286 RepID=UPI002B2F9A3C|nr:molecular chaperone HtpG [Luteolibacter sp. LG18]
MAASPQQRFQVDLAGILSVLSEHLYSTPTVAFRELLQNSTDAISARTSLQPAHRGAITIEWIDDKESPTLVVEDNGIGLTEDEVHLFLATIGGSSKRTGKQGDREKFIGQFGIGLLSCFVLSDEIVLITRSAADEDAPAVEWRGRGDGTYHVRALETKHPAGTRLYLKIKASQTKLCSPRMLKDWFSHYGEYLPISIELHAGGQSGRITNTEAPWDNGGLPAMNQKAMWEAGTGYFGSEFIDMVPISSAKGGLAGVAFISVQSRSLHSKPRHRLYLKGMLLSDHTEGIVPDWAVFVNVLANTTKLQPTASRESLMEGPALDDTREEIGDCILAYLRRLAVSDEAKLAVIIQTHHLALKSLALEDSDVLHFFAPWFQFETSQGRMSFEEIRRQDSPRYCISVDRYRQLAPVAAAENRCLINAGYVFDAELMSALAAELPDLGLEEISAMSFTDQLGELATGKAHLFEDLVEAAAAALRPHQCRVEARHFQPATLPVLYVQNDAAHSKRALEQSQEDADGFFSSLLGDISARFAEDAYHVCYLNAANPLIQRLTNVKDRQRLLVITEVLYLQALLLGQYPITSKETRLLSDGLLQLIEMGVSTH